MAKVMLLNKGLVFLSHNESGPAIEFQGYSNTLELWKDLAEPLTHIFRAAGRFKKWSVAKHSLLVSHLCPSEFSFAGLVHDLDESISSDIPTPFKELLSESARGELGQAQDALRGAIYRALGIPEVEGISYTGVTSNEVHLADQRAFALELHMFKGTEVLDRNGHYSPNLLGWLKPSDLTRFHQILEMEDSQVLSEHFNGFTKFLNSKKVSDFCR